MGFFDGVSNLIGDLTGTGESSARVQNQLNRDWQEKMSNTAIQRRVADMKAAGINPLLSVSGAASGASTPSGGSGSNSGSGASLISAASRLVSDANARTAALARAQLSTDRALATTNARLVGLIRR